MTATELPKVKFKQRGFVQKGMKRAQFFRFHMVSLDEHIANRYARRILWPGPSRPESTLLLRRAIPATGVLPNADNVLHNAKSKAEGTNFEKHWGGLQGLSYLVASVRGNMVGCTVSLAPTVRFGSDKTDVFQQVVLF